MSADEATAVTLAKMDGKLDLVVERLAAIAKVGEDHETRIRHLEARPLADPDRIAALEARPAIDPDRVSALEQRQCVTWRQLVAALGATAAVVAASTPFLAQLYGGH